MVRKSYYNDAVFEKTRQIEKSFFEALIKKITMKRENTMTKKKFECLFEREEKGIYLEVEKSNGHFDFSAYYNSQHQVSICLDKKDTEQLIKFLQENLKDL